MSKKVMIVAIMIKSEFSARFFPGHSLQEGGSGKMEGPNNRKGRLTFVQNRTHRHSDP